MEVQEGKSYILKGDTAGKYNSVYKVRVENITKTTIFLKFVDTDGQNRMSREEFQNDYKVIEELPEKTLFTKLACGSKILEIRGIGIANQDELKEILEEVIKIL